MAINLDFLTHAYFYFDTPVPYDTKKGQVLITPVSLMNSEVFLMSASILNIDKNSLPDVEIIQMSYLQFLCQVVLTNKDKGNLNKSLLYNILNLCIGLKNPRVKWENERTPIIYDVESGIEINAKNFDDIKEIIMHQNIPHYDDSYINPELKKAMNDVDELKNKEMESPSLERKMAIITAHTGLPKKEQQEMSLRSHSLLFEEVVGEVEFDTIRPPLIARGIGKEIDHWIFKKPKNKFEGYVKDINAYTQSMGGSQNIKSTSAKNGLGESYIQKFNNFN